MRAEGEGNEKAAHRAAFSAGHRSLVTGHGFLASSSSVSSASDGRAPSMLAMVRACSALARAVHVARAGTVGTEEEHALVVADAVNKCMASSSTVQFCEPDRVPDFLVTQHAHGMTTAFSPLMTERELSALLLQLFRTIYRAAQKASVVFDREEFAVWVQRMAVHEDEVG